jgi:hypothetical protein
MGKEYSMQRRCLGSRVDTNNSFFEILKRYEMFCSCVLCSCCDQSAEQSTLLLMGQLRYGVSEADGLWFGLTAG